MLNEKLVSPSDRGLDKEGYWHHNFVISALNPILLVLIRIVSSRRFSHNIGFGKIKNK